jgi:hypothetical protein
MLRLRCPIIICALAAGLTGCGRSSDTGRVPEPAYDPEGMVQAALRDYDKNKDGAIDQTEAAACPGLRSAFAGIDANGDGKLSADELQTRFAAYRSTGTIASAVKVTLNGAPLADATVKFTPEPCMLGSILEFTGQTGDDGIVPRFAGSDGKDYEGLQAGLYRLSVTKGDVVPARYNTKSTLGAEVFGGRGSSSLKFALTSP